MLICICDTINRSDISSDNVQLRTKIYMHRNYALCECICQEQKYTVKNKNIREQTRKHFNVTQKQLTGLDMS
jgi:hypothetical protein